MTSVAIMGRPTCLECAEAKRIPLMLPPKDLVKIEFCQFDCGYPSKHREEIRIDIPAPKTCATCTTTASQAAAAGPN